MYWCGYRERVGPAKAVHPRPENETFPTALNVNERVVSPTDYSPTRSMEFPATKTTDPQPMPMPVPVSIESATTDPLPLIHIDEDEQTFTQMSAPSRQALAEYRLSRIGRALLEYQRENHAFPLTAYPNEQILSDERLSWLVAMLPYLKQSTVYNAIDFDQAWNSVQNRRLSELDVPTFKNPILPDESQCLSGVTHFAGMTGIGLGSQLLSVTHPRAGVFAVNRVTTVDDIADGTSNTMAVAELGRDFGPWIAGGASTVRSLTATPYINGPDGLGGSHGMSILMADGSVRSLSVSTDDRIVRAFATIAGGDSLHTPPEPEPAPAPVVAEAAAEAGRKADDGAGREWSANGLGMRFCWCPAGSFVMGGTDPKGYDNTGDPPRPMTIGAGFWIGKYEVTQSQWRQVVRTEPWQLFGKVEHNTEYPATFITWLNAKAFCRDLTAVERKAGRLSQNREYRLSTEAEWEYACRAGTTTRFAFGDSDADLEHYSWYQGNAHDLRNRRPHEAGLKRPNRWGIFDMHGNVNEWCEDLVGMKTEGQLSLSSRKNTLHPVRGGGFTDRSWQCTSHARSTRSAIDRDNSLGFRIVLTP